MKCTVKIDREIIENEVVVYAKEYNRLICDIEKFVATIGNEIYGYKDKESVKLYLNDIFCFTIENGRVIAILEKEKFYLKQRLYVIEDVLNDSFLKINQSTIINKNRIKKFSVSFGGSLMVELDNGYKDFVSRRHVKFVKQSIGGKI